MASKALSEGDYDFAGNFGPNECDYKLTLLRKCAERVEQDMLTTRNCFDYILSEINNENEKIIKLMSWNQKRIELLKDIINKNQVYMDKYVTLHKEMDDMYKMKLDIKDLTIKTKNVKFENVK